MFRISSNILNIIQAKDIPGISLYSYPLVRLHKIMRSNGFQVSVGPIPDPRLTRTWFIGPRLDLGHRNPVTSL